MQDRERLAAAHDGLGHLAQLDHWLGRLSGSGAAGVVFDGRLQRAPHGVGDDLRAFGGRMDAVGLIQLGDPRDPLEQKRDERHAVFFRQRRIRLVKGERVVDAVVRRRFHARQDHGHATGLRALDDLREVARQFRDRQAAQAVVAAKRDHQNPDVAVERPVETRQTAGRRIARDAGVHDRVHEPGVVDMALEQRRIGARHRQSQTRGEAVAENHHPRPGGAGHRRERAALSALFGTADDARRASGASPRPPQARQARAPRPVARQGRRAGVEATVRYETSFRESRPRRSRSATSACSSMRRCTGEVAARRSASVRASESSSVRRRASASRCSAVRTPAVDARTLGFRLLILDVLAFEASRHSAAPIMADGI